MTPGHPQNLAPGTLLRVDPAMRMAGMTLAGVAARAAFQVSTCGPRVLRSVDPRSDDDDSILRAIMRQNASIGIKTYNTPRTSRREKC